MLTEAGERYFEMIAENVDRISDATQNVRGHLSVKSLIVRATPSLSTKWLLPRLGRFLDANPHFDVRVDATNEPTDFSREGVDIEIRHGEGNWPGLFVEGIAEERFLPVCAPTFCPAGTLEARRSPQLPPDPLGEVADAVGALVHGRRRRSPSGGAACCSTGAICRSTPP